MTKLKVAPILVVKIIKSLFVFSHEGTNVLIVKVLCFHTWFLTCVNMWAKMCVCAWKIIVASLFSYWRFLWLVWKWKYFQAKVFNVCKGFWTLVFEWSSSSKAYLSKGHWIEVLEDGGYQVEVFWWRCGYGEAWAYENSPIQVHVMKMVVNLIRKTQHMKINFYSRKLCITFYGV